jgi:hypothetical protein
MKIKSGGGITSNKLKESKAYKTEPKPTAISPAAVNQMGVSTHFPKEKLEQGPGYRTGPQQPTGIAGARKGPSGAGPGGMGRTIYSSGSQAQHGPVNPGERDRAPDVPGAAPGRDILRDYGPERGR